MIFHVKRISLFQAIQSICRRNLEDHRQLEKKLYQEAGSLESDLYFMFVQSILEIENIAESYEEESEKRIALLENEILDLKKRFHLNPTNSHKPPSTERHKKIKNSREKSGKKPGAQAGHPGASHNLHPSVDTVYRYEPMKCRNCSRDIRNAPEHEVIRKQEIEIREGKMHVTEYQTVIKFCPDCGQWNRGEGPKELQKSRVVFGPNAKSISIYLMVQQLIPVARVQEILRDLFGLDISQGSLCNFVKVFGEKLKPWEAQIKTELVASALLYADETGMRCEKKSGCVHVHSTESATLLSYQPTRGLESMAAIGVLPEYKGHLVHDAYSAYWNFGGSHSLCNGHILRELKYLTEEENQKWSIGMSNFLKLTLHCLHQGQKLSSKWRNKIKNEYIALIKMGFKENGYAKEWRGRPPDGYKNDYEDGKRIKRPIYRQRKHSKSMQLLNRLRDYMNEVLAFALKLAIPFTNNQAERDFRMIKLKEKISGCFRSTNMAEHFLRVRSYLSTLRKQEMHLLENLVLIDVISF